MTSKKQTSENIDKRPSVEMPLAENKYDKNDSSATHPTHAEIETVKKEENQLPDQLPMLHDVMQEVYLTSWLVSLQADSNQPATCQTVHT